jgi:3-oxoacyl-[acyl-carrier protein] reductase
MIPKRWRWTDMPDLNGRVALVTGATKGIGRAVAEALLGAGADVAISARTASDVDEVSAELEGRGSGRVAGLVCDVRRPDNCEELIETTVERLGKLDILINNAGVGIYKSIKDLSVDDWRTVVETNLDGVFHLCRAAVAHLLESDDAWIVNVGSLGGAYPFAGGAAYSTSKAGLAGLTESMRLDLRYDGIRVSLVQPGSVDTNFGRPGRAGERPWALKPADVARAVLQLMDYPAHAHLGRIDLRPSQPPRR